MDELKLILKEYFKDRNIKLEDMRGSYIILAKQFLERTRFNIPKYDGETYTRVVRILMKEEKELKELGQIIGAKELDILQFIKIINENIKCDLRYSKTKKKILKAAVPAYCGIEFVNYVPVSSFQPSDRSGFKLSLAFDRVQKIIECFNLQGSKLTVRYVVEYLAKNPISNIGFKVPSNEITIFINPQVYEDSWLDLLMDRKFLALKSLAPTKEEFKVLESKLDSKFVN